MTAPTDKLAALKALAEKATPGPWRAGKHHFSVVSDHSVPEVNGSDAVEMYGGHLIAESIALKNIAFIAAADPQTVTYLIQLAELVPGLVAALRNIMPVVQLDREPPQPWQAKAVRNVHDILARAATLTESAGT